MATGKKIRGSKAKPYRWEVGARLANEVQARNVAAAEESLRDLLGMIAAMRGKESFDEIRLRIVQVLSIANRAAYNAGANPHRLFEVNIAAIGRLIRTKSIPRLATVSRNTIRELIAIVPDKDYPAETKVDRALQYIREHCTRNISRETVAKFVSCSPSHLSHIFSRLTGHTFKQHVLKQRVEKAKILLRNTSTRIIDVAFEVGYDDPNYFSAAFKRVTGVTPLQYRKRIALPDG